VAHKEHVFFKCAQSSNISWPNVNARATCPLHVLDVCWVADFVSLLWNVQLYHSFVCEQGLRTFTLIIVERHICLSFSKWELYVKDKAPWWSIIIKHVSISLGFCSTLSEKNNEILFSLDVAWIVSKISHRMMTSFVTRETLNVFL
jgi:hypothetical protein